MFRTSHGCATRDRGVSLANLTTRRVPKSAATQQLPTVDLEQYADTQARSESGSLEVDATPAQSDQIGWCRYCFHSMRHPKGSAP